MNQINKNQYNLKNLTDEDYIIIGKMWEMKSGLSEHRVIKALDLKRPIKQSEIVHHLNGNHEDNRPENLRLCNNRSEHQSYHSDKIGKIRNELMVKQSELAKAIGITRTELSFIENKIMFPSLSIARKISKILKIDMGQLWTEDELNIILERR